MDSLLALYDYKNTGLPVLTIETEGRTVIDSKIEYVKANIVITEIDDTIFVDSVKIRGRGNATWNQPKKQYKIKFYEGKELFEMKKEKTFALIGNYVDKSLMHNAIGFKLGEILGIPYMPKGEYVELIINGDYLGTYMISETVKKGKNRLNIADSGFFVEHDYYYEEEPLNFVTDEYEYGFSFKYPGEDEIDSISFNYVTKTINDFEKALRRFERERRRDYYDYIDILSFTKWYYHSCVLMNMDPNRWFFKNDNTSTSKLEMAPPWDFEWCLGTGWYNGDEARNPIHEFKQASYFTVIFNDSVFKEVLREVHEKYKASVYNGIMSYYEELKSKLAKSAELNFKRWDILDRRITFNHKPLGSWIDEVNCDIEWFINHQEWLEEQLGHSLTFIVENEKDKGRREIYNLLGQKVKITSSKGVYIIGRKKYIMSN